MAANIGLIRRNVDESNRSLLQFDRTTTDVGRNIDKLSGRLGLFVDLAATLGPALIPSATALVPLLAGLSNQLGFAVIAGGSTILAFQGVGDALKAVNEQAVNPSVANFEKMNEAMSKLGPAGRDFVNEIQSIRPEMQKLQDAAQAGLFPGMTEGIESLMTRMPQAERIIGTVTDSLGSLLADAGESLAGPQWDEFFNMLEAEARPTLMNLGESIGQVTKGLAELWIAFAPLNRDFSQGMLDASKDFAEWADGLSKTQGFADFMAYLDETGPQVSATLGAIGSALLDVLEAAAPLGGPALAAIKAFANAISAIADSDIGPPLLAAVAAMRAFSLASTVVGKTTSTAWGAKAQSQVKSYGGSLLSVVSAQERANTAAGAMARTTSQQRTALLRGAAGAAALGLAATGMADKIGVANTATLGLAGAMLGPWGAAAGATVGAFLDLKSAGDSFGDTLDRLNAASASGNIAAINKELANTKAEMKDINDTSGFGDFFSDLGKSKGASLANLIPGASITSDDADAAMFEANWTKSWDAVASAARDGASAVALSAQGFQLTAAGAKEAAGGIEAFTFAMRGAMGVISRQGAWDSYRSSLLDAADAVKENGRTLKANGDIIRGQGRDMQRMGLQSRGALRTIAQGAIDASGQMKNFANRTKFLDGARRDFINLATSMGMSRAAARNAANGFGLIDRASRGSSNSVAGLNAQIRALKGKIVDAKAKGADESSGKVRALRAQIAALHDKSVSITISTLHLNRTVASGKADHGAQGMLWTGGVRHYAYGDVANRHMPELAGPGPTRVWREPETMGEAYIPLANDDRRPRARAIAAETVSLLGGTAYFADGGLAFARGGGGGGNNDDHPAKKHVDRFAEALKKATKAVEREKSARDALMAKRTDLSGSVRDSFLSDPFAGGNVWAAGGGNPLAVLRADIAKAKAFQGQLGKLSKQGLDGSALAAIAATGDVGKAASLSALGKSGVAQYESLYQQRAQAAGAVGTYAGSAAYGAAIAKDNAELRVLNATVRRLERQLAHRHRENNKNRGKHAKATGEAAAKGVNKGAAAASRRKR